MTEPFVVEEITWARWGRRAVTVPTYLCLGVLSLALLPVMALIALVIDAVRRTGQLVTLRCALALALYFVCEAVGIVASCTLEGTTSLNDIWNGTLIGRTIRLCFWRVPSDEIPRHTEGRVEWLDAQWAQVDAWTAGAASQPAGAAEDSHRDPNEGRRVIRDKTRQSSARMSRATPT